jgi:hypothetical protein
MKHNSSGHFLIYRTQHSILLDARAFRRADYDTDYYMAGAEAKETSKHTFYMAGFRSSILGMKRIIVIKFQ